LVDELKEKVSQLAGDGVKRSGGENATPPTNSDAGQINKAWKENGAGLVIPQSSWPAARIIPTLWRALYWRPASKRRCSDQHRFNRRKPPRSARLLPGKHDQYQRAPNVRSRRHRRGTS
jgi:hypothetical protein